MKTDLERAKQLLHDGGHSCVLCKDDAVYISDERGIKPLLGWLDAKPGRQGIESDTETGNVDLTGFSAADKVAGKAAAFLYVQLGVQEVYADVMSEAAALAFAEYGIDVSFGACVKNIINRAGTGNCPMEETVKDVADPAEGEKALREKLKTMKPF